MSGSLPDWISLGVLASSVPRDAVDEAVAACGKGVRRRGGKLPPHVVVYFAMAMALYADDDYEEIATRLSETLAGWGCWDESWEVPTSGGITQARRRLGAGVLKELFGKVAVPVAEELTRGAHLAGRLLLAIDGLEWDVPDTEANAEVFGHPGGGAAFPKARVVTIGECASHANIAAAIGGVTGAGSGEQSLARELYDVLEPGQLLLADRNFYSFTDWTLAAETGADLLWRVSSTLELPVLERLPDGSCLSVVFPATVRGRTREQLIEQVRSGAGPAPERARLVRVVEYEVPDRGMEAERELICLLTTITAPHEAPASLLAAAYHERWEQESGNDQLKTALRGPARILRSKSPDMIRQEIYGYLLTHYALASLICRAATEADIDPDRIKFTRTLRIVRRRVTDSAAFPP